MKPSQWQTRYSTFFLWKFFCFSENCKKAVSDQSWQIQFINNFRNNYFLKECYARIINHIANHNKNWNCITPPFLDLAKSYITFSGWAGCRSLPVIYFLRKGSIPFSQEKKKIQPDLPTYTPRTIPASYEFCRRVRYSNPGLSACNFSFNCSLFLRQSNRWCIKIKQKVLVSQKNASYLHS